MVVMEQVEEVRDQLVRPRATEVLEDMDEGGEEREESRRSFGGGVPVVVERCASKRSRGSW